LRGTLSVSEKSGHVKNKRSRTENVRNAGVAETMIAVGAGKFYRFLVVVLEEVRGMMR
jgi:hypothetical protein